MGNRRLQYTDRSFCQALTQKSAVCPGQFYSTVKIGKHCKEIKCGVELTATVSLYLLKYWPPHWKNNEELRSSPLWIWDLQNTIFLAASMPLRFFHFQVFFLSSIRQDGCAHRAWLLLRRHAVFILFWMISFKNKGFSLGLTELLAHLLPAGPFTYGPDSFVFLKFFSCEWSSKPEPTRQGLGNGGKKWMHSWMNSRINMK